MYTASTTHQVNTCGDGSDKYNRWGGGLLCACSPLFLQKLQIWPKYARNPRRPRSSDPGSAPETVKSVCTTSQVLHKYEKYKQQYGHKH